MDYETEIKFQSLKKQLEEKFGDDMDLKAIIFLVGVNELGFGYQEFSKQQKTDIFHIAICTLLEPFGYYEYKGNDEDNWPHFELLKPLPAINDLEQQYLLKTALIDYFSQNDYFQV